MTHAIQNCTSGKPLWARVWAVAGPVFGLLWAAVPVADFAGSDPSAWQIGLVAVAMPVFAYFFLTVVRTERPPLVGVGAMTALSVVLTLAALDSFALLFAFAGSAAAVRLEGRANVIAITAVTALAACTLALTSPEAAFFWSVLSAVAGTSALWLLIGGLMRTNAALREARAELADLAVADERLRFARDLHDLLGHDLSLIALKAELADRLVPAGADGARAEIDDIKTLTRGALTQVRQAVDGYRQPTLRSELAGARVALEVAGIELQVDGPSEALEPEVDAVLAWAVREGATNLIRHSRARHAEITLKAAGAATELEIADDGPGPDPSGPGTGHGLTGLRERAQSVGGTIEVGARPGGGFRLRVSVPAPQRDLVA
jgi:two-component system, NarL family, sensor histidine kinase DesK